MEPADFSLKKILTMGSSPRVFLSILQADNTRHNITPNVLRCNIRINQVFLHLLFGKFATIL